MHTDATFRVTVTLILVLTFIIEAEHPVARLILQILSLALRQQRFQGCTEIASLLECLDEIVLFLELVTAE